MSVIESMPFILFFCFHLFVIEVVYEGGKASGLILHRQRQHGNAADQYCVEEPRHLQVIAGTQSLENDRACEILKQSQTRASNRQHTTKEHIKDFSFAHVHICSINGYRHCEFLHSAHMA